MGELSWSTRKRSPTSTSVAFQLPIHTPRDTPEKYSLVSGTMGLRQKKQTLSMLPHSGLSILLLADPESGRLPSQQDAHKYGTRLSNPIRMYATGTPQSSPPFHLSGTVNSLFSDLTNTYKASSCCSTFIHQDRSLEAEINYTH